MKVGCLIVLTALLLTGCGRAVVYETVTDEPVVAAVAQPREISFDLAQEPAMPVMESDGGQLYLCGDYDVMVLTLEGGDLSETVSQVSGFEPDQLTVI